MKTSREKGRLSKTGRAIRLTIIMFGFLAVFFMTVPEVWCGNYQSAKSPDEALAKMKERLNLTDEQEKEIRPIMEQKFAQQKEIFQKYQGMSKEERQPMWGELQEVQSSTQEQLAKILSEKQMQEYQKIREEKKEQMRERSQKKMQHHRGAGMGMPSGTGPATETTTGE